MKISSRPLSLIFLLVLTMTLGSPFVVAQTESPSSSSETTDVSETNEPTELEKKPATAQQNFEMGVVAFSRGSCPDAIPLLGNAVDSNTSTDDLILITQMLSACLVNTGDINRARVLMQQILPLIVVEKGQTSIDYLNHNITWAEFELMVGARINAANRLTDGLMNYLAGKAVNVDEAYRALAAYATVMVAQNEVERFLEDIQTLKENDAKVAWSGEETLGQKIDALPPLDGTPTNLAVWALMAMEQMPGVKTFEEFLGTVIRGEGKKTQ